MRLRRAAAPRACCGHPELAARSLVVSSFGKTLHATGWKVGYCVAPAGADAGIPQGAPVRAVLRRHAAAGRDSPTSCASARQHWLGLPAFYQRQARPLLRACSERTPVRASRRRAGTYFQLARLLGGSATCPTSSSRAGSRRASGVAAIPVSVFFAASPPASASCDSASPRTRPRWTRRARRRRHPEVFMTAICASRWSRPTWPGRTRRPTGAPWRRHCRGLAGHTDLSCCRRCSRPASAWTRRTLAETMDGPTVGWMREEAAALGLRHHRQPDRPRTAGQCFNRLVWAAPDGALAHYDKRHLFRMAQRAASTTRPATAAPGHGDQGLARLPAGLLRPALPGLEPQPRRLRPAAVRGQLAAAPRARLGRAAAGARDREPRATSSASTGSARTATATTYAGDSVALDFLGQALGGDRGGDCVETVVLDLESLRDVPAVTSRRSSTPIAFELRR